MAQGELCYAEFASPFGPVWVSGNDTGVTAIVLSPHEVKRAQRELLKRFPGILRENSGKLAPVIREVSRYLDGSSEEIALQADLTGLPPFRQRVLKVLQTIPYGEVRSYQWVAVQAGSPRAFRAAGSACAANPLPLLIPCHRVIAGDGSLGGFRGGTLLKKRLLALEGVDLSSMTRRRR
ncbi:MAG: methylated-DNA--[protein]-cysteine S-methyltransferase [Deltaproteobacteria bacterium]|nr:methylated-DNA--[protein]-cysteine S-methyltransferase [Deltaproteobacteria bacterium]